MLIELQEQEISEKSTSTEPDYTTYFGSIHNHISYSNGSAFPTDAYTYAQVMCN